MMRCTYDEMHVCSAQTGTLHTHTPGKQVGTNLSMVRLAAQLETSLAKPVIAINVATYWQALRAVGVTEQFDGFGRLFQEF